MDYYSSSQSGLGNNKWITIPHLKVVWDACIIQIISITEVVNGHFVGLSTGSLR